MNVFVILLAILVSLFCLERNFQHMLIFRNEIPPLPASFNIVPTHKFDDKLDINPVKGVNLTLYHAPGETNDQIIVWWPQKRMLFPADNIYRAFPNLYAIRGTSARYIR